MSNASNTFHRVFVTGAGGFIGASLVQKLLKKHSDVHVLWKQSTNPWRIKGLPNIHFHTVDIMDQKALTRLMRTIHPEVIYHLAAHGSYPTQDNIQKMVATNIQGTLNLLTACRTVPFRAFIHTGSSSEYGPKTHPMKTTDVLSPISWYAATKASATHLCEVYASLYKKPVITLRPFSVYGPYEEPARFIPSIMMALLEKKPIAVTKGAVRRDFIYIDDYVDACLRAASAPPKPIHRIYNIGTGVEYTNRQVVEELFRATGEKTSIQSRPFERRPWDTPHWVGDISQTKKDLGWTPKYTLRRGLQLTYAWFQANRMLYEK